ncbi:MAG: hypothetical protein ACYC9N_20315 [Thermoanaerobaculia bacterium]
MRAIVGTNAARRERGGVYFVTAGTAAPAGAGAAMSHGGRRSRRKSSPTRRR